MIKNISKKQKIWITFNKMILAMPTNEHLAKLLLNCIFLSEN